MCGIIGKIELSENSELKSIDEGLRLMYRRGPDNQSITVEGNVSMGHARLSIIDVSNTSNQPVKLESGKSLFSFNGEIYNFKELSKKYLGNSDPASDTLVLKGLLEIFTLREMTMLLEGMFVIAVYHIHERSLEVVRDRIGEKPVYYSLGHHSLAYSSSLDSLRTILPSSKLNEEAFRQFFRDGYFRGDTTPFFGIKKLPAGHLLRFDKTGLKVEKYWDLSPQMSKPTVGELHHKLIKVIRKEVISDVPIGSFLSGGIDSTLVSAIMSRISASRVKTFSIGFENKKYDESGYAKNVADFLGTEHYEKIVTENDLFDTIPQFRNAYDEPFADSSAIPTLILAKMAKEHVTVALSGDGADELFGGYRRYFETTKHWQLIKRIPLSVRKILSNTVKSFHHNLSNKDFSFIGMNEKLMKYSTAFGAKDINDLYSIFTTYWELDLNDYDYKPVHSVGDMMNQDIKTYLVDDIMVKVDRATMYHSLESRAPFLHHEIVEYALRFSENELIKGSKGKMPLRQILEEYIPSSLIDRPKMGFGVPLKDWLSGPLKKELFLAVDKIETFFPKISEELNLRIEVRNLLHLGIGMHKLWLVYSLGLWLEDYLNSTEK